MTSKEQIFSLLRKVLIAALIASAVFLTLRTGWFSAYGERRGAAAAAVGGAAETAASMEAAAALRPRAVLVTAPDGGRTATAWDGETTLLAFRQFSALLGEALGSAGTPEGVSEAVFRAGLDNPGVLIDLGAVYPLSLLSDWVGTGGGGAAERSADILYLYLTENAAALSFRDPDGGWYSCATAAQPEALESRIGDFRAGGAAFFAFEDGRLEGVEPYTVVTETLPEITAVSSVSARDGVDVETLMGAFGLNSYLASSYYDADGALVLMEDGRTLRLGADGTLTYRDSAPEAAGTAGTVTVVNKAVRLARGSAGVTAGDADLVFAGVEEAEGAYTVRFDYSVNGIPVRQNTGSAVEVVVSDGIVRRASAVLRRYARTEAQETVLSMYRAAAVAAARGGGTPELIYEDLGDRVQCVWVNDP